MFVSLLSSGALHSRRGRVSVGAWSKGAGAWRMKVAERRPFLAADDAENGSEIANRNSL